MAAYNVGYKVKGLKGYEQGQVIDFFGAKW